MRLKTNSNIFFLIVFITAFHSNIFCQEIPITNYRINENGQIEIIVNSTVNNYYQLLVRHDTLDAFKFTSSLTLGNTDSTIISEALGSYPIINYKIVQHNITTPIDIDSDGINDVIELNNIPTVSPLNTAVAINENDGKLYIDNLNSFEILATTKDQVDWAEYLNERAYVKFAIKDFNTDTPQIYFINSNTYNLHLDFLNAIGLDPYYLDMKKGEIIFHPNTSINANILGTFSFNLSNGFGDSFENIQRCHELLASNFPLIKNNFAYLVTSNSEIEYAQDLIKYQNSRIPILLESELYEDFDYWALNAAEGFGLFHKIEYNENPNPRDIVLYETLPNDITRVGGIITSQFQSPLSHINLRAIQNKIPNSFIREPLLIDSISNLLNHYIYYKVEKDNFIIKEASIEEVNNWYEKLRPKNEQNPPLNLSYQNILPLDDIEFEMATGFGPKCTNVAVMRNFDFPEGTIPNGFGIPFYYYQEFMNFNHFFDEFKEMYNNSSFQTDRAVQELFLAEFREKIENAPLPNWMLKDFTTLQNAFPDSTAIRCRSSSNNEDLPNFSGAGLYTSKTQHPNEGHIAKSIKQVYASMWNLRAFEEREFYKINHFISSMGVLCHPNYSLEKANGVGVSFDPLYNTGDYFYLNSQVNENLITNPNANSLPEEILLTKKITNELEFRILRYSNQTGNDSLIMNQAYLMQMREYLSTIHNEFYKLYDVKNGEEFAMDIEYKIKEDGQLIIKQARPWIFNLGIDVESLQNNLTIFPNPSQYHISFYCKDCALNQLNIYDLNGELMLKLTMEETRILRDINIQNLAKGIYFIQGILEKNKKTNTVKFLKF
jgi:hypothetical protein